MALDAFQAEVARIALEAAGEHGFALAGGNALVAHGLVARDTHDVDLFSNEAGSPGAVTGAVVTALEAAGYDVAVTRPPELNAGEFAQLVVRRGNDGMQLDMARDWRKWPPVRLEVGPVLHLDDAVSSKVNAMVGRWAPRDFIDVAAAIDHGYTRAELMTLTFTRDPGLRVVDFTEAMRQLDQLHLDDFYDYGFAQADLDALCQRFADWPRHEADDEDGRDSAMYSTTSSAVAGRPAPISVVRFPSYPSGYPEGSVPPARTSATSSSQVVYGLGVHGVHTPRDTGCLNRKPTAKTWIRVRVDPYLRRGSTGFVAAVGGGVDGPTP